MAEVAVNPFEVQAREVSPEEAEERARLCHDIEAEIKQAFRDGRTAMWRLAKAIYEFNAENGWTALGYEKQEDWLAQPDITMTRSEFFWLVRLHKEMVINRGMSPEQLADVPKSKLQIVMPAIEGDRVEVQAALDDAKSMGARDLRETYTRRGDSEAWTPQADGQSDGQSSGAESVAVKSKDLERVEHDADVVDSWLSVGGDKRKARRAWARILSDHPVFRAASVVEEFFEPSDGAEPPSKDEVRQAWLTFWRVLSQWHG